MHHSMDTHDLDEGLDQAAALLRKAERVTVLTGAGVSAESGVPTFRGAGGLWEGHRVEEVATPEAFEREPELVWRFYNLRRASIAAIQPNPGHRALAAMEKRWGTERFTLITQNIDGLHLAAGSRHVLEVHGRLSRVRCDACGIVEDRPGESLPALPRCEKCQGLLRPDVVWFGEMLPQDVWRRAHLAAEMCNCFLIVGTSAIVYPAAGLVISAKDHGAGVIEVNLEQTPASELADISLFGPSGQILPELVRRLG